MSISLTALRDQIILDAGIKSNPDFGVVRINRIINLAQRYVQAQLNGLGFKKFETSATVAPISGTFAGQNIKKFGINALTGILESPRNIIFIEVTDGSSTGIAYPTDANKFKDKVVNTYDQATMKDPVFTRLANNVLLTPSGITSALAYYYRCIQDLSDSGVAITGAVAGSGIVTVTANNHGLSDGNAIQITGIIISGGSGMTDLNGIWQVDVINSSSFTVPLTTSQVWSTGGTIICLSEIPTEFEDFIIRKSVMDINIDLGKIQDKAGALNGLDNDLTNIFNKFYGTVQSENINNNVQNQKMQ